jgi:hypothetical protein
MLICMLHFRKVPWEMSIAPEIALLAESIK